MNDRKPATGASAATAAVHVRSLRKDFGKLKAVDGIDFAFHGGQVHGFIGPNGAGKTTTMRILSTIDRPSGGDALIMGWSILDHPHEVRRRIGFVPDWFAGFDTTTVHEYLDFFARACELRGRERLTTIGEIEEFTGLLPLRDKLIKELSRGMQQRVCLGRSLVNNPDVLLMDEPAANLDPRARIELRELVKALAERGKAILISSHILAELSEVCDSVTILDRGRILASGNVAEIKRGLRPHRTIAVRALAAPEEVERALLELPGASRVHAVGDHVEADLVGEEADVAAALRGLVAKGLPVIEFSQREDNLEDIFMRVTGGTGTPPGKEADRP
jgi:ABC-2 type transport system ATP-binding protein